MNTTQCIRKAIEYIEQRYSEQITVADIGAQVFQSPSYFSFIFRTMTGYTVKNYLNKYRLYRAARDLRESDEQIISIAYIHGFSSQQAFTKSFTQMYGISPARFRLQRIPLETFPPTTFWKENNISMELEQCFKKVDFKYKEDFFVVGFEVDINYHTEGGTDPIKDSWDQLMKDNLKNIPDQKDAGVTYGITHSETAENTGKYIACVEVTTLEHLPIGMVGRKFGCGDYAIFETTCAILETGDFWRTFYAKWLPQSGYKLPDKELHDSYCTFNQYPAIEVYGKEHNGDADSLMCIYAPVVKK